MPSKLRLTLLLTAISLTTLLLLYIAAEYHHHDELHPVNPGSLSKKHAYFINPADCKTCHAPHDLSLIQKLPYLWKSSDPSNRCLDCHSFEGKPDLPHNTQWNHATKGPAFTRCTMCHTEHKGPDFDIRAMSDKQCQVCHQAQFTSFAQGHPDFPPDYPYANPNHIHYDHKSHAQEHFKNPQLAKFAPQSCNDCHTIASPQDRYPVLRDFEKMCQSCHLPGIQNAELLFFRMPKVNPEAISPQAIEDACGPLPQPMSPYPISEDKPSIITESLFELNAQDEVSKETWIQNLILSMSKDPARVFDLDPKLLQGLTPEVVKHAACSWLQNREYEALSDGKQGYWYADFLEIRYKPMEHKDPVIQAWIEYAHQKASHKSSNTSAFPRLKANLIDPKSAPGQCVKCHNFTSSASELTWSPTKPATQPHTHFDHSTHVKVLGHSDDACMSCHQLNPQAATSPRSEFKPIAKNQCVTCHAAGSSNPSWGNTSQSCTLCHTYHKYAKINKNFG